MNEKVVKIQDPLFPIGTVVQVENSNDELETYLIIGHRIINDATMRAWDYVSVPYPKGLQRYFKSNREKDYDNFFYFNHGEIDVVIQIHEPISSSEEEN